MTHEMRDQTRARKQTNENCEALFRGKSITPLLLRQAQSFSSAERELLLDYYSEHSKEHLLTIAEGKKIIPFVADVFIKLGRDEQFWRTHYDFYLHRNRKIRKLLDSIFSGLEIYGCESVVLTENFGVLLASYGSLACFCSGDVDLSADIAEKDDIVNCLRSFSFESKDQPSKIGEYSGQSMQFYNDKAIDGGFWINVIWKPVTRAFLVQDKYELRLNRDRLIAKKHGESSIKILEDSSLLYFCALHSSAGHYFTLSPGLRLFVDIDRMARKPNIKWQNILDWEIEDGAGIRISMALYLANKVFKTPIPAEILLRIESSSGNRRLLRYLFNSQTNQIQSKSSIFRRLYIELASDNKNLVINFVRRILLICRSKLYSKFT
jgi:hypothetical protein